MVWDETFGFVFLRVETAAWESATGVPSPEEALEKAADGPDNRDELEVSVCGP